MPATKRLNRQANLTITKTHCSKTNGQENATLYASLHKVHVSSTTSATTQLVVVSTRPTLSNCSGRAFVHRTVCSQILYQHLLLQRNQSHLVNGLFHTVKRWPCCLCSNLLIHLIKASSESIPMPFVGSRTGVGRLADRSARRHSLGTLTTLVSVSSGVKVRV